MANNKLEGEMIDQENKMMAKFKKERQEKIRNIISIKNDKNNTKILTFY